MSSVFITGKEEKATAAEMRSDVPFPNFKKPNTKLRLLAHMETHLSVKGVMSWLSKHSKQEQSEGSLGTSPRSRRSGLPPIALSERRSPAKSLLLFCPLCRAPKHPPTPRPAVSQQPSPVVARGPSQALPSYAEQLRLAMALSAQEHEEVERRSRQEEEELERILHISLTEQ